MKKPTRKIKRTHVPALNPLEMQAALDKLKNLPLNTRAKDTLGNILRAAANPHSEAPDAIIKTLPSARRKNVEKSARQLKRRTADVMSRGRAKLMELSESEWQALVDSANDITE